MLNLSYLFELIAHSLMQCHWTWYDCCSWTSDFQKPKTSWSMAVRQTFPQRLWLWGHRWWRSDGTELLFNRIPLLFWDLSHIQAWLITWHTALVVL